MKAPLASSDDLGLVQAIQTRLVEAEQAFARLRERHAADLMDRLDRKAGRTSARR
jgi:hypothetical protein